MAVTAVAPGESDAQPQRSGSDHAVRVKIVCSHCDRVVTRHSRKGYTVRCPHCGTVNAGPALIAEQGKAMAEGARRRVVRRERAAEQRAEREPEGAGSSPSPSAPAPVRRKRTAPAPAPSSDAQPGNEAKGAGAAPRGRPAVGAAPASTPTRRGFFDRLMGYGEDGDDD